jgi:hypothetical protein
MISSGRGDRCSTTSSPEHDPDLLPKAAVATRAGRARVSSGGAVKGLVEPCKASAGAIRKASAEVAHRRVSLPPPQLPEISPAIFVTVRASPAPLYGQEMAEMAASRHLVCQQAVPWRATSGFALDGRTRARRDPRDRVGRAEGLNAKSRWERRSPEPEHLVGGELGDHGGGARPERSRRRWTRTRVEQDRQRVTRRDRWTVSAGATRIERLSSARRAASKGGEIGTT